MLRQDFIFGWTLNEKEIAVLKECIMWRTGSRLLYDLGNVIGCVAHPDDVVEFRKRLREQRRRQNAKQRL